MHFKNVVKGYGARFSPCWWQVEQYRECGVVGLGSEQQLVEHEREHRGAASY